MAAVCFEGFGFADDDFFDAKLDNGARAEVAGHEGGIEGGACVGADAACVLEAVDFCMEDGVAALNALVVATADDLIVFDEDGSDGDATCLTPCFGFLDGGLHMFIHFFSFFISSTDVLFRFLRGEDVGREENYYTRFWEIKKQFFKRIALVFCV